MDFAKTILGDVKEFVGLDSEGDSFDPELLMHVNGAIGKLNQNGVGKRILVNRDTTWDEFKDPDQTLGNEFFNMVPLFIALSTKLIFDPPPPSSVQYHDGNAREILWRLKIAFEGS